jgi:hypothetical protein
MIFEAILLLLWLIAAWIIRLWAVEWGKPPLPYFLTSLFLTPALPAFVLLFKGPAIEILEASAIAHGRLKRCRVCAEAIRARALVCRYCDTAQDPLTD